MNHMQNKIQSRLRQILGHGFLILKKYSSCLKKIILTYRQKLLNWRTIITKYHT